MALMEAEEEEEEEDDDDSLKRSIRSFHLPFVMSVFPRFVCLYCSSHIWMDSMDAKREGRQRR